MFFADVGAVIAQTGVVENFHNGHCRMHFDLADTFGIMRIGIHSHFLIGQHFGDTLCHFVGIGHHTGGHNAGTVRTDPVIKSLTFITFALSAAVVGRKREHRFHSASFDFGDHIGSENIQGFRIGGANLQPVIEGIHTITAAAYIGKIFRVILEIFFFG